MFFVSTSEKSLTRASQNFYACDKNLQCVLQNIRNSVATHWRLALIDGVVEQWCNPLTLQPEQSGGVPPLERHDKGSRTRLALSYFCNSSATSPLPS